MMPPSPSPLGCIVRYNDIVHFAFVLHLLDVSTSKTTIFCESLNLGSAANALWLNCIIDLSPRDLVYTKTTMGSAKANETT